MRLLTSECVTIGHPDKVCDQISDAILDAHLEQDADARVAAEAMATAHGIIVAGEVSSAADVDVEQVVRRTLHRIGYTRTIGLDPDAVPITDHMVAQSSQISGAVDGRAELGAGDQGMMFGYATNETPMLMPAPLMLARAITRTLTEEREAGRMPWLRPDGKAQVTVGYEDGRPAYVDAVVVSTQHSPDISLDDVRASIEAHVIPQALGEIGFEISTGTRLHLNPAGEWTLGGPAADTGLTGRKIIVDTYGGAARHGGGAFSGKDPSKVDRSAAYAARAAARLIVGAGMASRAEVQLSYAIGEAQPVSVSVEAFGTNTVPLGEIEERLEQIDFTPQGIIDRMRLQRPIYGLTAALGHFGVERFPWEQTEMAPLVQAANFG